MIFSLDNTQRERVMREVMLSNIFLRNINIAKSIKGVS